MTEGAAHCRMTLDDEGSPDFVFLSVNKAFVALTGLNRAKGRKMSELFAGGPPLEPELLALFSRVSLTGVHEKLELYVAAFGQWLSISTYSSNQGFFLFIFEVVTERRKAEFTARQWQRAFEQSGTAMGLTNVADDTVESLNPAAERMLGYTTEEVIGRPLTDFYPPSEWARRAVEIDRTKSESGHVRFQSVVRRKDGSLFPALLDSTLVRGETGEKISSVNLIFDLTALKRAEANRRETEQTFRAVLESAPQAILAVSQEGRIVFVNRMAGVMFGYTIAELAGRRLDSVIPKMAGDSNSSCLRHYFTEPHSRPVGLGLTLTAQRRDRTLFPVEMSLSFIEGTNLSPHQVPDSPLQTRSGLAVAFISDISERKRLEATANEHALQIQALSASLLTSQEDERRRLSRELHDGLCQQLAYLSIKIGGLMLKSLPGDLSRELRMLQARTSAAADAARHIAHELHPSSLDDLGLVVSLQGLCDEFSAENGIPVRFTKRNVPRSVSREIASCFYRIAQQSLRNIAQHAGACHVSVDISFSGGAVILSVDDDGVGFDPEKIRGCGSLGLTGMQERARLVNGTLSVASRPRQGTRVEVEIPCLEVRQ